MFLRVLLVIALGFSPGALAYDETDPNCARVLRLAKSRKHTDFNDAWLRVPIVGNGYPTAEGVLRAVKALVKNGYENRIQNSVLRDPKNQKDIGRILAKELGDPKGWSPEHPKPGEVLAQAISRAKLRYHIEGGYDGVLKLAQVAYQRPGGGAEKAPYIFERRFEKEGLPPSEIKTAWESVKNLNALNPHVFTVFRQDTVAYHRLFSVMNYFKYQAFQEEKFNKGPSAASRAYRAQAQRMEDVLVMINTGLVRKALLAFRIPSNTRTATFFEKEVERSVRLAIQDFDVNRGHSLSTYAWPKIRLRISRGWHKLAEITNLNGQDGHPDRFDNVVYDSGVGVYEDLDNEAREKKSDELAYMLTLLDDLAELPYIQKQLSRDPRIRPLEGKVVAEVLRRNFGLPRNDGEYAEPQTLAQIGRLMNLSRERVRQIKVEGLKFLRAEMQAQPLPADSDIAEKLEED